MSAENDIKKYEVIPGHVFVAALLESVERMSGFVLTEVKAFQESEQDNEIIGAMVLQGVNSMLLTLGTNKKSAAPLVSFMTGIETEDLDQELLNDGITELINMVGGSARASLEATNYKFILSVPFTLVGEGVKIVVKKRTDSFMAKLVCDQLNLMLRVYKL
ncbi:chemotaxis protein CheX [Acetobacterium carbinolicum]|uniref:chemotaxis protein CheX n=1 Tax=Acetobacterium carbinolicum TaxID=52690 RepID=UPI0039C95966